MGCVEMDGCPHRARPVTPALRVVNSGHALWPTVTRRPLSDDDFAFWQDSPFVAGTLDRDGQGKGNRANAPDEHCQAQDEF